MTRTAWLVLAALAIAGCGTSAQAVFVGPGKVERVPFATPTLAPVAHTRFCLQSPDDCRIHRMAFRRPHPETLTRKRLDELLEVNRFVNRAIIPRPDRAGILDERWHLLPQAGACHDYAVTKRHYLLAHGWPSRALLLAEVVVPSGEHHLVLVVRTDAGDLVLDNLAAAIRPWLRTPYRWVRIQSPANPIFWSTVSSS
jgi:predicted transglutaminase-like cysteine proteinase